MNYLSMLGLHLTNVSIKGPTCHIVRIICFKLVQLNKLWQVMRSEKNGIFVSGYHCSNNTQFIFLIATMVRDGHFGW